MAPHSIARDVFPCDHSNHLSEKKQREYKQKTSKETSKRVSYTHDFMENALYDVYSPVEKCQKTEEKVSFLIGINEWIKIVHSIFHAEMRLFLRY